MRTNENAQSGYCRLLNFNRITDHPQFDLFKAWAPPFLVLLHPAPITDHIRCVNDKLHQVVADQHTSMTPVAFHFRGFVTGGTIRCDSKSRSPCMPSTPSLTLGLPPRRYGTPSGSEGMLSLKLSLWSGRYRFRFCIGPRRSTSQIFGWRCLSLSASTKSRKPESDAIVVIRGDRNPGTDCFVPRVKRE